MNDKFPNQYRISELWNATKQYADEHSIKYTSGDGVAIENDIISVTNPNRGIYTKEEFEALTPEQQKSGTYIVNDGGEDVMVGANIYSTEETVIGRWIDGRPIYKRVINTHSPNSTGSWVVVHRLDPNAIVVNFSSFIYINRQTLPLAYSPVSNRVSISYTDNVGFEMIISTADMANKEVTIIAEYTNATDNPTINLDDVILPAASRIVSPKLSPSKSGTVEVEGQQYDYELPDDVFVKATSAATSVASSIKGELE